MPYSPTNYVNEPATTTPISAANLNKTEQALAALYAIVESLGGHVRFVAKVAGVWGPRPTSDPNVLVIWVGPDPSPPIVSSGTGGMRNDRDTRFVTP